MRFRRALLAVSSVLAVVIPTVPAQAAVPAYFDDHPPADAKYVLDPGTWPTRSVTYRLTNTTPDLPYVRTVDGIQRAFRTWEQVLPLKFVPVEGRAQIEVTFTSGNHGDDRPFDGPNGELAHANFPPPTYPEPAAGDIHFDEGETWTTSARPVGPPNRDQPIDLTTVALHEIGHAIGLQHSYVPSAVMWNDYAGPRTELTPDDIAGARAKYARPHRWSDLMCRQGERCTLADVTGDDRADAIAVVGTNVWVAPSTGTAFAAPQPFGRDVCPAGAHCDFADVNGDGKADVVAYLKGINPQARVALSTGTAFGASETWSPYMCPLEEACATADVDGDGRADAVAFTKNAPVNTNEIWVARSTGRGFAAPTRWLNYMCPGREKCYLADVSGDNLADAIITNQSGEVWVAYSVGTRFLPPTRWAEFGTCWVECAFGDVNEDHKADVIGFKVFDDALVSLSTGSRFGPVIEWADDMCRGTEACAVGDVDGDGAVDTAAFIQSAQPEPRRNDVWVTLS